MGHQPMIRNLLRTVSIFSILAGILSITMLMKQGFEIQFVAPLTAMLDWYDGLVVGFGRLVEPWLAAPIAFLNDVFSWRLALQPQWPHSVVGLCIVFGGWSRMATDLGNWRAVIRVMTVGVLTALVVGVVPSNIAYSGLIGTAMLILGIGSMFFLQEDSRLIPYGIQQHIFFLALGLIALSGWFFNDLSGLIVTLLGTVVYLSAYLVLMPVSGARVAAEESGMSWTYELLKFYREWPWASWTNVWIVPVAAVAFVALNAGLSLLDFK